MKNNKKTELKEKLEALVKEKLEKFRKNREESLIYEIEEEEKCIEPFLMLDPEQNEALKGMSDEDFLEAVKQYCEEEGVEMQYIDSKGEIHEFKNLSEVLNEEACPSVEMDADGDIPLDVVQLDDADIQELKEVADDIKAVGNLPTIPCEVNGENYLLVDTINCNIKPVFLLGINLVTPLNVKITKILLDADVKSYDEIGIDLLVENPDGSQYRFLFNLYQLVNAGLVSLIQLEENEIIKLSALEVRGITAMANEAEFQKLF